MKIDFRKEEETVSLSFMLHANSGERRSADFDIRGKPGRERVQEPKKQGRDPGSSTGERRLANQEPREDKGQGPKNPTNGQR